jgi:CBS domain-containing protein
MNWPLFRLTQIIRSPLADLAGESIGSVKDLVVRLGRGAHPPVVGLQARIGGREVFVPIGQVSEFSADGARLRGNTLSLQRFERRDGEVLLRHDILRRKVIDVETGRLMTAFDIALADVDREWQVVGIDTAPPTILQRALRRLPTRPLDRPGVVDWSSVEPFVEHVPTSRLRLPLHRLRRLHPAQIADLVEAASHDEGKEIISAVHEDPELEADVFEELDTEHQVEFLQGRSDTEAAAVLDSMGADDAADLIADLPQERRASILARLPMPQQAKVRSLLAHNPSTAGGLMTPDLVAVKEDTSVREALERVRKASTTILAVHVTDQEGRLIGSVSLQDLLRIPEEAHVADSIEPVSPRLHVVADFAEVALLMADYNLTEAPVVDDDGLLVGVISVDDVLETLIPDPWRRREGGSAG